MRCIKLPDIDHIRRRAYKSSDTSGKATNQHLLIERHHHTWLVNSLLRTFIDAEASQGIGHLEGHHISHMYCTT